MGYWENTTYIRTPDARAVADALTATFEAESVTPTPRPSPREPDPYDPMQYGQAMDADLWGIAVFPGGDDWTLVKTAPLELLGERAPGRPLPRLAELAVLVDAPAFQLNVYDSTAAVLLETDGRGSCLLSGYTPGDEQIPDPMRFHDEHLDEERIPIRFEILPLQHVVTRHTREVHLTGEIFRDVDYDGLALELATELAAHNAPHASNLTCVQTLVRHEPLSAPDAIELYFRRSP